MRWSVVKRTTPPMLFDNGKLFEFHYLFPGGRKGYVRVPGEWKSQMFGCEISLPQGITAELVTMQRIETPPS